MSLNLSETAKATITYKDFLKKFIDTFSEHFETDFINGASRLEDDTSENEEGSPKMQQKPFFRRYAGAG